MHAVYVYIRFWDPPKKKVPITYKYYTNVCFSVITLREIRL